MIEDAGYYTIMIFAVAIAIVISFVALDGANTGIQNSTHFDSNAKGQMSTFTSRFSTVFDATMLVIIIGVMIAVLALLWFLPVNGLLFFAMTFVIILLAGVAGYLANAWNQTMETTALSAAVTNFPLTNFVMSNYMVFIVIFTFLMFIVYFSKPQTGGTL